MTRLCEAERIARLRLVRSETVGPVTFHRLLGRFGSAVNALESLPHMAAKGGRKNPLHIMSPAEAARELTLLDQTGGHMIVFGDEAYPATLAAIEDAPPVFYAIGDVSLLSKPCIAIVGARNASANAKRFTAVLARDLGGQGQVIVSGLARGIDTAAHEASLESGTVAVLAGGIDEIYPAENADLYNAITENGCVISEMPIGTKPTAHHFPRRNRIVSGLSRGTVVVEASVKSGSLITARMAAEQGREVFAVPGFPGDPRAAGPNSLIQSGARLVTSAKDILQELTYIGERKIAPNTLFEAHLSEQPLTPIAEVEGEAAEGTESGDGLYGRVIDIVSHMPIDVDDIVRDCNASVSNVQTVLLDLELAGKIQRHPGNRVSRTA